MIRSAERDQSFQVFDRLVRLSSQLQLKLMLPTLLTPILDPTWKSYSWIEVFDQNAALVSGITLQQWLVTLEPLISQNITPCMLRWKKTTEGKKTWTVPSAQSAQQKVAVTELNGFEIAGTEPDISYFFH